MARIEGTSVLASFDGVHIKKWSHPTFNFEYSIYHSSLFETVGTFWHLSKWMYHSNCRFF